MTKQKTNLSLTLTTLIGLLMAVNLASLRLQDENVDITLIPGPFFENPTGIGGAAVITPDAGTVEVEVEGFPPDIHLNVFLTETRLPLSGQALFLGTMQTTMAGTRSLSAPAPAPNAFFLGGNANTQGGTPPGPAGPPVGSGSVALERMDLSKLTTVRVYFSSSQDAAAAGATIVRQLPIGPDNDGDGNADMASVDPTKAMTPFGGVIALRADQPPQANFSFMPNCVPAGDGNNTVVTFDGGSSLGDD